MAEPAAQDPRTTARTSAPSPTTLIASDLEGHCEPALHYAMHVDLREVITCGSRGSLDLACVGSLSRSGERDQHRAHRRTHEQGTRQDGSATTRTRSDSPGPVANSPLRTVGVAGENAMHAREVCITRQRRVDRGRPEMAKTDHTRHREGAAASRGLPVVQESVDRPCARLRVS